jgi:hypothetical protein
MRKTANVFIRGNIGIAQGPHLFGQRRTQHAAAIRARIRYPT